MSSVRIKSRARVETKENSGMQEDKADERVRPTTHSKSRERKGTSKSKDASIEEAKKELHAMNNSLAKNQVSYKQR